jgi:succinate-acetate transporter protein
MSSIDQKPDIFHREIEMSSNSSDIEKNQSTLAHPPHQPIGFFKANPAPIGFGAFALCAFVLGLYNSGLVVHIPQVAMGVALGYGAMGQFVCGISELIQGNMFAATSMLTFSGFFFTFGIMMTPSSGFMALAMETGGEATIETCLGLVQIAFSIASFLFLLGTFRQPILIRLTLLQVWLTFLLGGIGGLIHNTTVTVASGWISFTLSLTAWYIMASLLCTPENTFIKLPFF